MFFKISLTFFSSMITLPKIVLAAAGEAVNSGYLEYKDPALTSAPTTYSSFFYVLSILLVFGFVLMSAYFVSKFVGRRFGRFGKTELADTIVGIIPVDQNKKIVFMQISHSLLMLGITEQNITLLKELTDSEEIEQLKIDLFGKTDQAGLLDSQFQSLDILQDKLKPLLRNLPTGKKEENNR